MRLARPVWVDDDDFDITYHVRRSALPSPGSDEQLHELIGRLAARPLDRVAAALGDVSGRGPGQEPAGALHQVASGADQRHGGGGDQPRHRRPQPPSAAVRRRHLGARPRTGQSAAAARRGRRLGHPPAGAAEGRPQRGRRSADQLRPTGGRRPPDVRRRPDVGARLGPAQPAEHHGVAQSALHGGVRTTRRLPGHPVAVQLRRQRRGAGGHHRRAA